MLNECGVYEVHFVLYPQNPFKTNAELWSTAKRWDLLTQSIADNPRFKASDIELHLPTPSYTSQTLKHLESQTTTAITKTTTTITTKQQQLQEDRKSTRLNSSHRL